MRPTIFILLGIATSLLAPLPVAATDHLIHVQWAAYQVPVELTVVGYSLYQDGQQVCHTKDPWVTALDCTVNLSRPSADFTLTARFSNGTESPPSAPFTYVPPAAASWKLEAGEVALSHHWTRVAFAAPFNDPIVVASPPGFNNNAPCTVRLRNISRSGFEIRIAEWDYLDKLHPAETVSYLAVERGSITLANGLQLEADRFNGSTKASTVRFKNAFSRWPVVLTSIASTHEADTISGRIEQIRGDTFSYRFREQEASSNRHGQEIVNYLALEAGSGTLGTIRYEAATTYHTINHRWSAHSFKTRFTQPPMVLADMQTLSGTDTTALRLSQISKTGFKVKAEEEQSADREVWHPAEIVGYLALDRDN